MTEAEWHSAIEPILMLEFLRGKVSDRKLRLFSCASGRRNLYWMDNYHYRNIIEVTERYADSVAKIEAVAFAYEEAGDDPVDALDAAQFDPYDDALQAAESVTRIGQQCGATVAEIRCTPCNLLRDIFGNPFRPAPVIDPSWLAWHDGAVSRMARSAYDDRRFPEGTFDPTRLAVLADALEDAGCSNAELLAHLRGPGPHVRGCWAVDLILGH